MVASITGVQSPLNFDLKQDLRIMKMNQNNEEVLIGVVIINAMFLDIMALTDAPEESVPSIFRVEEYVKQ
jgi:hypothetical protein